MQRAPQLVTVVTASGAEGPRGITVSSFVPVSMEPPLVLVSIQRTARAHDAISAGRFRVHLLAADQARISRHFAKPGLDSQQQFEGTFRAGVEAAGAGAPPWIPGCIGWTECRTVSKYAEGDHTLFLGRVVEGRVERGDAPPLLYHDRGYRKVGERLDAEG